MDEQGGEYLVVLKTSIYSGLRHYIWGFLVH